MIHGVVLRCMDQTKRSEKICFLEEAVTYFTIISVRLSEHTKKQTRLPVN